MAERYDKFRKRNDVRQLFRFLQADLAGRPGFPWDQVRRLAVDPTMQGHFQDLLRRHQWDSAAARQRLIDLCDPGGYSPSRAIFADEVLQSIEHLAHRAVSDDRDAVQHIVRRELDAQYPQVDPVALLDAALDPATLPPDVALVLKDLRNVDSTAATQAAHIRGEVTNAVALAVDPPSWCRPGTGALWEAIARLCAGANRMDAAIKACEHGRDQSGADRVLFLIRASRCASAAGDSASADELHGRAKASEPQRAGVQLVEIEQLDEEHRLAAIEALEPNTRFERYLTLVARADALMRADRLDDALALVDDLEAFDEIAGLDRRAAIRLFRARKRVGDGEPPNREDMRKAATNIASLINMMHVLAKVAQAAERRPSTFATTARDVPDAAAVVPRPVRWGRQDRKTRPSAGLDAGTTAGTRAKPRRMY
jgi:hypothetical protein